MLENKCERISLPSADGKLIVCPEIEYREDGDSIVVTGWNGEDEYVALPNEIDGKPVKAIAPYGFSETNVREISFGRYVQDVGRYAFYRCRNLQKMTLHDQILEIGGGALTGCRFQNVEIHFHGENERSALKSIVDEIRYEMHVRMVRELSDGEEEVWEILFPEHYEEAVENTPARILYTSHHGAGGYYRQCFYDRELDYKKYDELLPRAIAEEAQETVVRLSLARLIYPHKLSEKAKEGYETYVKEHMETAATLAVQTENMEMLRFFGNHQYWSKEVLEYGIELASELKKTEVLSMLMDERHRLFPKQKKTFAL